MAQRHLLITGDGWRISALTYTPLSRCWRHVAVQQWWIPKPDSRKSRFFPQLGGPRQNSVIMFGMEELEWCGYQTMKNLKICLFILTRTWQMDRHHSIALQKCTAQRIVRIASLVIRKGRLRWSGQHQHEDDIDYVKHRTTTWVAGNFHRWPGG